MKSRIDRLMTSAQQVLLAIAVLAFAQLGATQSVPPVAEHIHPAEPVASSDDVLGAIQVDFSLLNAAGRTVTAEDFRGRYFLLAFGYTRCTDVCPLMAANMAMTIRQTASELVGIFISVDTERDDVVSSNAYASAFGDGMLGLGGTHEQVAEAAKNFQVSFAVTKTQHSYTVQHSSHLFLVDPQGELADVFAMNANPADIAAAVQ